MSTPPDADLEPRFATDGEPPLKLDFFLPYRLNVMASLVSQALARIYGARYGLGIPEWRIVATLGEFGTMTAKQIGTHSHMHKTKVSRAAAALEGRGLLARRANTNDLREAFLSLTAQGRAIYDDLVPVALAFEKRLIAGVDPNELAVFERVVGQLTGHALRLTDGADPAPEGP